MIFRRSIRVGLIFVAVALLCQSGCVQRRMLVRSNPPGAVVYVDDYDTPIGVTPVSTSFLYYGTRKIRLVKDGYETLTVMQPISAPWYQFPPMDFIAENFMPGEIRDQRTLDYQLKPQMVVPGDQLRQRAEELRRSSNIAPVGATLPPGTNGQMQPVPMNPAPAVNQSPQTNLTNPPQNVYPQQNPYQQQNSATPQNVMTPQPL